MFYDRAYTMPAPLLGDANAKGAVTLAGSKLYIRFSGVRVTALSCLCVRRTQQSYQKAWFDVMHGD